MTCPLTPKSSQHLRRRHSLQPSRHQQHPHRLRPHLRRSPAHRRRLRAQPPARLSMDHPPLQLCGLHPRHHPHRHLPAQRHRPSRPQSNLRHPQNLPLPRRNPPLGGRRHAHLPPRRSPTPLGRPRHRRLRSRHPRHPLHPPQPHHHPIPLPQPPRRPDPKLSHHRHGLQPHQNGPEPARRRFLHPGPAKHLLHPPAGQRRVRRVRGLQRTDGAGAVQEMAAAERECRGRGGDCEAGVDGHCGEFGGGD
jgi:hypothetical protein